MSSPAPQAERAPLALLLMVAFLPAVLSVATIAIFFQAQPLDYVPHSNNDAVGYWRYALTFAHVGLAGGIYSPDETLAPFSAMKFDAHGPALPLLYGSLLALLRTDAPGVLLLANMLLLALCIVVYGHMAQLSDRQTLLVALALASFWPLMDALTEFMQEGFHYALYLAWSGIFAALLRGWKPSRFTGAGLVLGLVYLAWARMMWGFLLLPLLVLLWQPRSLRAWLGILVSAAALWAVALLLFRWTTPSGNNAVFSLLSALMEQPLSMLSLLLDHFSAELSSLLAIDPIRIFYFLLMLMLGLAAWGWAWHKRRQGPAMQVQRQAAWLIGYVLLSMIVFVMFFYYQTHLARLIAGPYLLALGLLAALFPLRWTRLLALLHVSAISFINFDARDYSRHDTQYQSFAEAVRAVVYQPDAPSDWCNTLLVPLSLYDSRMQHIQPGIGISYVLDKAAWQGKPIRSRYVLMDDAWLEERRQDQSVEAPRLQALDRLGNYGLYINEDALCDG